MCACMCVRACVNKCVCACVCVCVCICVHACLCMCLCVRACVCVQASGQPVHMLELPACRDLRSAETDGGAHHHYPLLDPVMEVVQRCFHPTFAVCLCVCVCVHNSLCSLQLCVQVKCCSNNARKQLTAGESHKFVQILKNLKSYRVWGENPRKAMELGKKEILEKK